MFLTVFRKLLGNLAPEEASREIEGRDTAERDKPRRSKMTVAEQRRSEHRQNQSMRMLCVSRKRIHKITMTCRKHV